MEHTAKIHAVHATQPVRSGKTAAAQHKDVIYILGPDSEPDEYIPVREACEASGLSFHLVGDGSRRIFKSDIADLHRSKLIGPDTHVFVSGHGLTEDTGHTVLSDEDGDGELSTVYLIGALLTDPDAPSGARPGSGVIHILACEAGSLKTEFTPKNRAWTKGSCLVHANTKNNSLATTLPNAIAVVELLGHHRKRGFSVPHPQLVFAKVAAMTGECITLFGGTLTKPLTWHAPKNGEDVTLQNTRALELREDLEKKFLSGQEGAGKVENKDDSSYTNKLENTFTTRIQRGKEGPARKLLAQKPFLAQVRSLVGTNSLMHAAQAGLHNLVHDLIQHGAKVDSTDPNGMTALHHACSPNIVLVAAVLLRAGTDINVLTNKNETPLFISCALGHFELTSFFLSQGANPDIPNNKQVTPLIAASENDYPKLVTLLLKNGVNCNAVNHEGNTALHQACKYGYLEIVEFLLDDDSVDLDIQNNDDLTPLFFAARRGHEDILYALLDCGADPEILDADGNTVLHSVYLRGREDLVDFLLDTGHVNINARTGNGETLLCLACAKSHYTYVRSLCDRGADMNLADDEGHTPLMRAAIAASPKTVQALVDVKADLNAQDITGFTALMHACFARAPETVLALLKAGASTRIRDIDGKTASDLVKAQLAKTLDRNFRIHFKIALDLLATYAAKGNG